MSVVPRVVGYGLPLLLALEVITTLPPDPTDFPVYYRGASDVLAGLSPYRAVEALPFTYPPFAALVFTPLTWLSGDQAFAVLSWTSLLAYVAAVLLVARHLRLPGPIVGMAVAVGLVLEPVTRTLELGQINHVLLLLVLLDVFVVPPRFRGILIGIAAGIKLTPAFFGALFLLRRDLGSAVRAVLTGVGTLLVGFVILPDDSRLYWFHLLADSTRVGGLEYPDNQSLVGIAARWLEAAPPGWIAVPLQLAGLTLGVLAAARYCWGWSRPRRDDVLPALLCIAAGGLLASPVSWSHHYVWLVPALLWFAARGAWWPFTLWLMTVHGAWSWLPEGPFQNHVLSYVLPALMPLLTTACLLAVVVARDTPGEAPRQLR